MICKNILNKILNGLVYVKGKFLKLNNKDFYCVLKLLKEVGPMLVTSANISGQETLLNDQEVYKQFKGKIKMIVKGKCKNTLASTVIKVDEDVTILRQGCIQEEEIREVLK